MSLSDLIPGVSQAKLIGAGVALAGVVGLLAFGGIQTARLHHAKADLVVARAALNDPVTKKTWQSEAEAATRDLVTCRGNEATLDAARQAASDSVERLQREAEAASKANRARQEAAHAGARDDARAAARIMSKPASGDLCASALELMREP